MKKRITAFVVTVVLVMSMILPVSADDADYNLDYIGLGGNYDSMLESRAAGVSENTGVIVSAALFETIDGENLYERTKEEYESQFGEADGFMLSYAETEEIWTIYKSGALEERITSEDEETLWNAFAEEAFYEDGVEAFLDTAEELLEKEETKDLEVIGGFPKMSDLSGTLDAAQINELETLLGEISTRLLVDVDVVLADSFEGMEPQEYAESYYDDNGYGYGENNRGILLAVSLSERQWWMVITGQVRGIFGDEEKEELTGNFTSYLKEDDYYNAFLAFAEGTDSIITEALKDGYDLDSTKSSEDSFFDPVLLIVSLLCAFILSFVVAVIRKKKLTTVELSQDAQEYTKEGSLHITLEKERYINKVITTRDLKGSDDHDSGDSDHDGCGGSF